MCKIKYLNDEVIKKALAKDKDNIVIRNYVARLISDTTGMPYEELEGKSELLYPEVSVNKNVVNSEVDLVFKEGYTYFNIEINYGRNQRRDDYEGRNENQNRGC